MVTGEENWIAGQEIESAALINRSELAQRKYYSVFYDIVTDNRSLKENQFYHFSSGENFEIEQIKSSLKFLLFNKGLLRNEAELELINITEISEGRFLQEKKGRST
jgi:hypothetical protein